MPEMTFSLEKAIPAHLVGQVQSKLAYVDERILRGAVSPEGDRITLWVESASSPEEAAALREKVQQVVTAMARGALRPKVKILEDHLDRPVVYASDPLPELERRGEVFREAQGIYTLGPLVTRLIALFERRFEALADSFEARPHRFPTLIPASNLARVNYFRAFPHSLTFATHLRTDFDVINHFAEHAACDEHGHLQTAEGTFAPVETLLSPAVCYHLYFSLADKPLPAEQVVATAVGNCFRYESSNLNSLERLWNFTMREVIFVGSKDFVLEQRETARQRMQAVFEEIGLAYRVESANDPFFVGEFRKQAAFQTAFDLKFEIRARLPFKDDTLAVGSYNYHQDFFGRHLNITLPDGSPAHTGCVAFGLERMAFAFLAQFGFDESRWPQAMRRELTV
ncbi:MAG: amino acid--[acyl-carrier-protein] ligase [Anaerolineales bacterium]